MPSEASPSSSPDEPPDADLAAPGLTTLGAESETERAVKRIVPWIVSVAGHAGLVVLGFLITWTVVLLQRDEEPPVIVADFNATTYDPVVAMALPPAESLDEPLQDRILAETADFDESLTPVVDPIAVISDAARETAVARFAPDPSRRRVSFVGLSSTNARRIVYVIDASGSMIRSLPIVIEELARSLDGLAAEQSFSVVFFQGNEALSVPPPNRLVAGTTAEKVRVLSWINEHVIPAGRSSPLAAIERGLGLEPDVIFLLSENITGSGEFEIDQADLLSLLDRLNPRDEDTGRRRVQINCVQFLDPDPLGTLQRIAEEHGGERGYKFLDREELGLRSP